MAGGMQQQVYANFAPGAEGGFCDMNPRFTVDAGPFGLVAGLTGAIVGRWGWATYATSDFDGAPATVNSYGTGLPTGFMHRTQQGLITTFLADATLVVPQGFPVSLLSGGGVWVRNKGTTQALPGQKAFANFADGTTHFATAGTSATTGGTSTTSTVTSETLSVTGSIGGNAGNILTVTVVGSGMVFPGATITNSPTTIASGTMVVSQLTSTRTDGKLGGTGTYSLNIPEQSVASGTITGTYGLLTVSGTIAGLYQIGDILTGGTVGVGSVITVNAAGTGFTTPAITGTGGSGTYVINNNTSATSAAIDVLGIDVETKWIAMSSGLAGELVKISDHPLG